MTSNLFCTTQIKVTESPKLREYFNFLDSAFYTYRRMPKNYSSQDLNTTIIGQFKHGFDYNGYFIPHFDAGMIGNDNDRHLYTRLIASGCSAKMFFDRARLNYTTYMLNSACYSAEVKIPKIIHQIWVGSPVPEKYLSWIQTWKQHHPGWVHKLWTDADIPSLQMINKKYFDEAEKGAEKADILRYELVYRFGGLYVDIDFECFKSFDLFHHVCDFYAGFHILKLLGYGRVANGLFAARPGHPIVACAVREIKNNRHHKALMFRAGPDFFTGIIKRVLPRLDDVSIVFPANFFYPYGESGGRGHTIKKDGALYVKPETVAAHYYEQNW